MDIEQLSQIATSLSLIFISISAIVAWFLLINQQKINRANTHLKLREMFCQPNHFQVHSNLRPGGLWTEGNAPETLNDWTIIDDYLGLFEVCEKLLDDKILDEKLFEISYKYRLQNVASNIAILERVKHDKEYWSQLINILKRFDVI